MTNSIQIEFDSSLLPSWAQFTLYEYTLLIEGTLVDVHFYETRCVVDSFTIESVHCAQVPSVFFTVIFLLLLLVLEQEL